MIDSTYLEKSIPLTALRESSLILCSYVTDILKVNLKNVDAKNSFWQI